MVKTHLPGLGDSFRQKLRPKHQLLVNRCYPTLPKNSAADVKPNSSELSYLLYYASSRRSKLQKVGTFLERKAANDVYKAQSARVLVTLQILTALLENKVVGSGNGFAMIAPYVLRTLEDILQNTNDISLVEASGDTWAVFCKRAEPALLGADHEYRELYEQVVRQWIGYAQKSAVKKMGKATTAVPVPVGVRMREAGLSAIRSMLVSDTLSSEVGRRLDLTIPAILSNLRGENAFYLTHLQSISARHEQEERNKAVDHRQSISTVRTNPENASLDSDAARAAEGTVQDADALAEEGVAVAALECLKTAFETDNRSQVRSATGEVLKYLAKYQLENRPETSVSQRAPPVKDWVSWAVKLFEMITAWTAVQDRFVLLVTASETLTHLPLKDPDLGQHLLLTHLIDDILRSDLNLIGLSVMDILLGLIQQILRVLQLGGPPATGYGSSSGLSSAENLKAEEKQAPTSVPSQSRVQLLSRLKSCIADLATHIYYTDQIGDMLSAILLRLKPNSSPTAEQNPAATAAAIEEPLSAVSASATNISVTARDRSHSLSGGFFTFDTARQIALEAVRDVIIVANSSRSLAAGGVAESRNPVPLATWEGTQWLLRDPSPAVRRAYVDALGTWLALETKKADARIQEPKAMKQPKHENANGTLARRALSNASNRERQSKKARNTFLQLLHLAIYENALQHAATSESDILLLHLVNVSLVQRLGVNAVQSSLPMMFALQEEIAKVESPVAKVRLGSLVHGYFWQLGEQFQFEHDSVGREIYNEISRRKQHGTWMDAISVPAAPLERIPLPSDTTSTVPKMTGEIVTHEALTPFDGRQALVSRIAEAYATVVVSPMPSPPGSPGRSFSMPALDRGSSYLSAKVPSTTQLPDKVKDAMLATWTKDACLAAIAAAAPKSVSLSGSRSSPQNNPAAIAAGNHRQLLAAASNGPTPARNSVVSSVLPPSPPSNLAAPATHNHNHRQHAFGLASRRLHSESPDRRTPSTNGGGRSSSATRGLRVEELKRVLSGASPAATSTAIPLTDDANGKGDDTASESLMEVGEGDVASDLSFNAGSKDRSGAIGKTDLASLLEGLGVEEEGSGGKVGMIRPPY